jgi:NAD(P)-dependent dehydrogenase (short-subunit alcohol dehydrogenase family)
VASKVKDIDIPDQDGKLAVVTGANSGIGLETARRLAMANAQVVLACRNATKAAEAVADIRESTPHARVVAEPLDLSSLESVQELAALMVTRDQPIDILVNNAGIMAVPTREETKDGFELQFGTNVLGHFALTGRLFPLLRRAAAPRVVTLSSTAARIGRMDFDDLQSERRYNPWRAYGQSKLADLLFAKELARRSATHGWGLLSAAAHPGSTHTNLQSTGRSAGGKEGKGLIGLVMRFPGVSQLPPQGALPTLYAATSPEAENGGYYGPDGFQEMNGLPAPAHVPKRARRDADAARLWDAASELTGVRFPTT